jgi:hypothetical protein
MLKILRKIFFRNLVPAVCKGNRKGLKIVPPHMKPVMQLGEAPPKASS